MNRWIVALATLAGISMLALAVADLLVPARDHIFGLSRVFAPYLAMLFVPIGLIGLLARGHHRVLLPTMAAIGIIFALVRFVPALPTGAAAVDADLPRMNVASWNIFGDFSDEDAVIDALTERAPAVIALQELSTERAELIAESTELRELYPYQLLRPRPEWDGLGLLSSWPMEATYEADGSIYIAADVAVPGTEGVDVVATHAMVPLDWAEWGPSYLPHRRDAKLADLRAVVDESVAQGRPVVMMGDLNLTDREIAYDELTEGLIDTYKAAGTGLGHTWRLPWVDMPFALLRLDMAIVGPAFTPVASQPDCTWRGSDHCILDVELAITRTLGTTETGG